jgi:hypothetical protein
MSVHKTFPEWQLLQEARRDRNRSDVAVGDLAHRRARSITLSTVVAQSRVADCIQWQFHQLPAFQANPIAIQYGNVL